MVEVTKEDERAAVDIMVYGLTLHEAALAFARHRHTSTAASEARIAELEGALKLAANRLARVAVDGIALGDKNQIEYSEWASEARQALKGPTDAK